MPPKAIYQPTDTVSSITPGAAGVNQTWNMSALMSNYADTLFFIPYSWAPNADFSTSNLVLQQGTQNIHSYLNNNSAGLSVLGTHVEMDLNGSTIMVTQKNSPAEMIATFPYTYNSGFTNDYIVNTPPFATGSAIAGVDSARMKSNVHKVVTVDAWGTLTTPLGTYPVIRTKEYKVTHDTTDAYVQFLGWVSAIQTAADSSASYSFWANSVGFPLVEIGMDSVGVSEITWLQALPVVLGINETTAAVNVGVYPNPAQNEINLAIDAATVSAVQIFDITGKMVSSTCSGNYTTVTGQCVISGSSYSCGSVEYYSWTTSNASTGCIVTAATNHPVGRSACTEINILPEFTFTAGTYVYSGVTYNNSFQLQICGGPHRQFQSWNENNSEEILNNYNINKINIIDYGLSNFPNPFYSTTNIHYVINENWPLRIEIYNVLGNKIKTLINECNHPKGEFDIIFDGENLTPGVYFYTLYAGKYKETKRMIIMH